MVLRVCLAGEGSYINSLMRSTKSMSPDERAVYIEKDDKLEKAHHEVRWTVLVKFLLRSISSQAEHQGQSRPPAEDESVKP